MNFIRIVILSFLIIPSSQAGLGFYCKHALSLALKGYAYHKDYNSSLSMVEGNLYKIKMLTAKMMKQKKPSETDKKKVLKSFNNLNSDFIKHKETITKIAQATSCAEDHISDLNKLQVTLKKSLEKNGIRDLNKVSTQIIETLNSIK